MSRSRSDFYFDYDSEKLRAARMKAGLSVSELGKTAGVTTGTISGYESHKAKQAAGSKATLIADALGYNVSILFEHYDDALAQFKKGEARKLTSEEKGYYAVTMIRLIRFFVNEDLNLWAGDFEEGFSAALVVFADVLDHFKKPTNEGETLTALRAYVKQMIHFEGLKYYRAMNEVQILSLESPIFQEGNDGANAGELARCIVSTYSLEDHVIAREELRTLMQSKSSAVFGLS